MRAKKSLGQNWLKNSAVVDEILDASDPHHEDLVVEIGPGLGVLTEPLVYLAAKLIAIEKDHRLIELLKEKFAPAIAANKLELLEKDILDFDPGVMAFYDLPYKVIANIPYYLTGQIIRKFLEASCQPKLMVLMVQKEVAKRIVASDGKESILSMSVKAFGIPRYVKTVSRGNFSPAPNVDSAIISIEKISKDNFRDIREEKFFDLLHRGFGSKRKQLKNNLGLSATELSTCGIGEKARAEELTLNQWLCLTKKYS